MIKYIIGFILGSAVTFTITGIKNQPTLTNIFNGWKLEHIPVPACDDDFKRTVELPERDEVDAMTITCVK